VYRRDDVVDLMLMEDYIRVSLDDDAEQLGDGGRTHGTFNPTRS